NTVVCLGELLIDFVPQSNGLPLSQVDTFHRAAGGAPANVAAAVAKLGGKSRFIGKVGRDPFGEFLRTALEEAGVEPALTVTDDARTGLAFDAAIFHFGSVSLIAEPCRTATLDAARRARAYGALVSYDPNVRLPLWTNADFARRTIIDQLPFADLVKVSEDEIGFLYGGVGIEEGARLMLGLGPRCVVVTLGAAGCRVFTQTGDVTVPGVPVEPVDTTGAGDGFVGGLLWKLAEAHIDASGLDETLAEPAFAVEALRFANAVGALATTKRGAIPALPARSEVERKLSGEA
ncbi:MAG: kdgK, partial [Paenibacillus sp.]|nr:kdgK [Paenibacillus sp.]